MIENNYGLILILSCPCLVFLSVLLFRQVRDTWMRHRWIPAPATIVEIGTTRDGMETIESMIRERGPWWVHYRYRTLGATRVGRARVWTGPKPKLGAVVTIYVNPKAWRRSALPTTPTGIGHSILLVAGVVAVLTVMLPAVDAFATYGTGTYGGGFGSRIPIGRR